MKRIFAVTTLVAVLLLIAYKSGLLSPGITLTAIVPDSARPGETVTLGGKGLALAPEQTTIFFGNIPTRPSSVTENAITVVVPQGAASGLVTVAAGSTVSNARFLQITGGGGELPHGHPPMGGMGGMMGMGGMTGKQQMNPSGDAESGGHGAESAHQFWRSEDARDYVDFTLPTADGSTLHLKDHIGSLILVNFWATWCKPCLEEVPSLERLTARAERLGLKVLAVSVDKSFEEIKKALPDVKLNILLDPEGEVAKSYGTEKFPETWVIDAKGKIVARFIGSRDWDSPTFVRFFEVISGEEGMPEGM